MHACAPGRTACITATQRRPVQRMVAARRAVSPRRQLHACLQAECRHHAHAHACIQWVAVSGPTCRTSGNAARAPGGMTWLVLGLSLSSSMPLMSRTTCGVVWCICRGACAEGHGPRVGWHASPLHPNRTHAHTHARTHVKRRRESYTYTVYHYTIYEVGMHSAAPCNQRPAAKEPHEWPGPTTAGCSRPPPHLHPTPCKRSPPAAARAPRPLAQRPPPRSSHVDEGAERVVHHEVARVGGAHGHLPVVHHARPDDQLAQLLLAQLAPALHGKAPARHSTGAHA